ncbi:uncharacterized protein LOC131151523 [Malania oleifera]|uniref:uncharacterized protein LOC131151523 n=1 Tax=Malania oleifera TaxID=397392 RepID=UPI0025AEA22C|nr:uncharacterized protein LOC131151523 [Malania oleifera]
MAKRGQPKGGAALHNTAGGHPSSSQQPSPPPPPQSRPHSSNSSHEPRRQNLPVLSLPAPYSIHPCFGSLRTAATTAETSLCNSPPATSQKPQPRPPFQPSAANPTTPSSSCRQQQRPPATPEAFLYNSATTLPPATTESAATSRKPPRPQPGPSSSATSSTTTTILQAQTQDTRQTAAISTHRRLASPVPALCTHHCTLQTSQLAFRPASSTSQSHSDSLCRSPRRVPQ